MSEIKQFAVIKKLKPWVGILKHSVLLNQNNEWFSEDILVT